MSTWKNRIVGHGEEAPDQLLANPRNWRIHPRHQQHALTGVLREVGWVQQVVVNRRTGFVVDGHLRVALAISEHQPSVPVLYVDLSDEEEALVLATLDPIGAMARADKEQLDALLRDVQTGEAAVQELLASLADEAGLYRGVIDVEEQPVPDAADRLREQWQTAPGQLWQVGRHRVLCGDSTNPADVARLLDGQRAECIITDPPYDLPATTVRAALTLFADRAVVLTATTQAFTLAGDDWRYCIDLVWYHHRPRSFPVMHQPVFYHGNILMIARGDTKLGWRRPWRDFSSVVELEGVEYVDRLMGHGKPTALFLRMLSGFRWRIWADPFLGAGGTLFACERLGRELYGMEIDPATVAIALERARQAGLSPTLVESVAGVSTG